MSFYSDGNYYGNGNYYGASSNSPINLSYYYTDIDNVFVFSWTFQDVMFTPILPTFDYELQLDLVSTFNSPALLDYSTTSILGTSISGASPATTLVGGTLIVNINGDGPQTITLGTDPTGAAIAADIQAKVNVLTAFTPSNQLAYTNFTAVYTTVYTLTSGIPGADSSVVISGGTDAVILNLGLDNGGVESDGTFFTSSITSGTSISGASPATSAFAGDTLTINLNGDGAQTITLTTDASGLLIAADIQAKVSTLIANMSFNQSAYTGFTATYSNGIYTLTSGTSGLGSSVVVTGTSIAAALNLGIANGGVEAIGSSVVLPGISFQNGNVYKGFAVPVYIREAQPITFYARVRVKLGATYGSWSDTLLATTLQDVTKQEVSNLISNLPDLHVYPYDEAYKAVTRTTSQLSTNIGKVYWAYAREFDNANLEAQLADNDADIFRARDSRFFEIWGYPTGFQKPSTMQFVDYRNIINEFRLACFAGSTVEAVKLVVSSFTGIDPTITPFSQILNFITSETQVETHTVSSVGPYIITLNNLPRNAPSIPGFTFTDGIPGPEQYTEGTSTSAKPATHLFGGTLTINLNGDGPRTITLGNDFTEAAIAADIQAKVRALIAIHPANTAAYTNFTATYSISTGQYTLTSGTTGSSSSVVVTGASDALILKLGLAYRGTETAGTNSGSGPLAPGAANLTSATDFAVLASSTITNTGSSVVTGELGLYPGTSVTGFPPGTISGSEHIDDSAAHTAQMDANAAYTDLATRPGGTILSGDLSLHSPLPAGVYTYSSSAGLTGNLTLTGSATDVFIFQIGSTLTTAASSSVTLIGGAVSRNVFWQVGSSATLGTSTSFQGTIIAQASITDNGGSTINGRLIALSAAVTLNDSTITLSTPAPGSLGTAGTSISAVPSTSLSGGTLIIAVNGGVPQTITLGVDPTGEAIAADIQSQIRALFPLNPSYANFTAVYSELTKLYTLTAGLGVLGQGIVVSGGTNAPLLELGIANGGVETVGVPLLGYFSVNFATGVLTFNATNAGQTVTVTYLDEADIYSILESPITQNYTIPLSSPYNVLLIEESSYFIGASTYPQFIAFDGVNMWSSNNSGHSVSKITPTGGVTTYPLGGGIGPDAIAFDGVNMWTVNTFNNSVSKITPLGSVTTYSTGVGTYPDAIAFDGTNMWAADFFLNRVYKIAPNGAILNTYSSTGADPSAIAFDGVNMWTANNSGNSVSKITPIGGITTYSIGVGIQPQGIAFDGVNMWTANSANNSVSKISPAGVVLATYSVSGYPRTLAFDGTDMWSANYGNNSVSKITSTGVVTTYPTGSGPVGIAFDGLNMWTANTSSNNVTKIDTLPILPRSCPSIPGFTFTDGIPGPNQFSVNFSTGVITFNVANRGASVAITYLPNNLNPVPPVAYNRLAVGASVIITMNNPADFVINTSSVEFLLDQIIPAHVEYILVVN
jgi:hypothetical protein